MISAMRVPAAAAPAPSGEIPEAWMDLRRRIDGLPESARALISPSLDRAIEDVIFRARVVEVAREALSRLKLDLDAARFDLDATRREREMLRARLAPG